MQKEISVKLVKSVMVDLLAKLFSFFVKIAKKKRSFI